jgi:transposase
MRQHSEALKQELVERSLEPGASVAAIAQEHGINANLPFNWRRLRLRGQASAVEVAASPTLLPVTVQMEPVWTS